MILHSLLSFWLSLTGLKRCANSAELAAYIHKGDVQHLAYWIENTIWYRPDMPASDNWTDADTTIARKSGDCDCTANIAYKIINTWPGWMAGNLYIVRPGGDHAACVFWGPENKGLIDGQVFFYDFNVQLFDIVKEHWPTAVAYYYCDDKGRVVHDSRKEIE